MLVGVLITNCNLGQGLCVSQFAMSVQLICFAKGRGEGRAKYHGGKKEKKERRIQARGAKIRSPAP